MKTESPLWAIGYIVIFLAINSATILAATLIARMAGIQLSATVTIIATAVSSIATIALFTAARWAPVPLRSCVDVIAHKWIVLAWCAVCAIGAVIPSLFIQGLLPSWPDAIQEYIDQAETMAAQLMSTRGGYAVLCLLVPVAEEVVFRGAVLRTLLAWQPRHRWAMIALSALLFAAAHLNPAQLIHPFVIGLLLGWLYERTGSIVPGVVYHWANNTVAYLLFHFYADPSVTLTDIFGSPLRAVMAVFFSLLIIVPAIYQLNIHCTSDQA